MSNSNPWIIATLFLGFIIAVLILYPHIFPEETVNIGGIELTHQDACDFYKVYGSAPFYLTDIETGNEVRVQLPQNPCEVFGLE